MSTVIIAFVFHRAAWIFTLFPSPAEEGVLLTIHPLFWRRRYGYMAMCSVPTLARRLTAAARCEPYLSGYVPNLCTVF